MNKDYDAFRIIKNEDILNDSQIINAYDSSWEHLADELRRLDILLRLHLKREQGIEVEGQLAGMVLSTDEILSLLEDDSIDGCDENDLVDELVKLDMIIAKRLELSLNEGVYLSLPYISQLLDLRSFEERCIVMCIATELDLKYQKIYTYFQNDLTAKSPTIDFVMELLAGVGDEKILTRPVFDLQSPLMKFLMDTGSDLMDRRIPLIARPLKLEDWIVSFLLDFNVLDHRLSNVAQMCSTEDTGMEMVYKGVEKDVVRFVSCYWFGRENKPKQIFYLYGPPGSGKKYSAQAACERLGLPLIIVDVEKMLESQMAFSEILWLLGRQAMIGNSAVCLENFHCFLTEDGRNQVRINMIIQMINTFVPLTFILGQSSWNPDLINYQANFIEVEIPLPDERECRKLWEELGGQYRLDSDINLSEFGQKFRFTPGQIRCALNRGENLAVWKGSDKGIVGADELYKACYAQSNRKLNSLAAKMKVTYSWDMLVLPDDQKSQLKEITNQVKYRWVVYDKWGFNKRLSLGKGLNVLFSGPPGSGKTMAAEVIANELKLEIYKIDVSQVVSKYIGETEKNLAKIFNEAQTSNAILFFDEADALFGKRSDVKDAHDRYANIETSYLLQKMEEYKGIVILATNLNQNIDEAFLRRLHFNVVFPFPEAGQRKQIWLGIFPPQAPLDEDIDFDFMAEKFTLAGGNIKNIALNAAFYAAQDSCKIGMKQIMLAAKREYKKIGKTFLKSDYDPYYQLIEVI